jgi:hypothetical protein
LSGGRLARRIVNVNSGLQKKTGLVGPASYSVELRCGYITARRMLAPKVPPAGLARSVRMQLLASAENQKGAGTLLLPANAVPITAIIYYAMETTVID